MRGREIKRETLGEMAEYVNTPIGQKIFTEAMMPDIVEMVKVNLFRTLPPQADDFDPEEDEPAMEPAWPHLQVVYEFFLRFIVSTEVNGKVAKKYVDQSFIRMWVELFDAEDPRERDYVKTVLHRIYGKFMSYRSYIRKAISQVFFRYIYETGRWASYPILSWSALPSCPLIMLWKTAELEPSFRPVQFHCMSPNITFPHFSPTIGFTTIM